MNTGFLAFLVGMLLKDAADAIKDPDKFPKDIRDSIVNALEEQSTMFLKVFVVVTGGGVVQPDQQSKQAAMLEAMFKLPSKGEETIQ